MTAITWTAADTAEAERRMATNQPLTLTQSAHVLNLTFTRGRHAGNPNRRLVLDLIGTGRLRVVDADQPQHRWTVAPAEIHRYLNGGRRLALSVRQELAS